MNIGNIFILNFVIFQPLLLVPFPELSFFILLSRLVYVDSSFSTIKLKAVDTSGREHLITLKLKPKVCALL